MIVRGIDLAEDSTSKVDCFRKAGYEFVGRYYNVNRPLKNLSRSEAEALSRAGLTIVAVWENGFPIRAGYFTSQRGRSDALAALRLALQIGQPESSAIYFAVDYDASVDEVSGPVTDYFTAIKATFEGRAGFAVGVYGSGATCKAMTEAKLATFTWLSLSTGWRGSHDPPLVHIKQLRTLTICGGEVDEDEACPSDCGGFVIGGVVEH